MQIDVLAKVQLQKSWIHTAASRHAPPVPAVELLERRRLCSASAYQPIPIPQQAALAGVPYDAGDLAALGGVDTSQFSGAYPNAIVRWGDHSAPSMVFTSIDAAKHEIFAGLLSHTYGRAATYTLRVSFVFHGRELGRVAEPIVVAQNTPNGLTLHATVAQPFTQSVGTFMGQYVEVDVNWGDGSHSAPTIQPTGNNILEVIGTHTYRRAGRYRISVSGVPAPPVRPRGTRVPPPAAPIAFITLLQSTAIVTRRAAGQ